MKWDLQTYYKQPSWFINEIWAFMNTEIKARTDKDKENG